MADVIASAQSVEGLLELIHAGRRVCVRISSWDDDAPGPVHVESEAVYLSGEDARRIGARLIEWADRFDGKVP